MDKHSTNYLKTNLNKCSICTGNLFTGGGTCHFCGQKFCINNPQCGSMVYPFMVKNLDKWYQDSFSYPQAVCTKCMPPALRTASKLSVDNYYDILFSEIFREEK
jgi:hypothetical protein